MLYYCSVRFPRRSNRLKSLPTTLPRFASYQQVGADSRSDSQALNNRYRKRLGSIWNVFFMLFDIHVVDAITVFAKVIAGQYQVLLFSAKQSNLKKAGGQPPPIPSANWLEQDILGYFF